MHVVHTITAHTPPRVHVIASPLDVHDKPTSKLIPDASVLLGTLRDQGRSKLGTNYVMPSWRGYPTTRLVAGGGRVTCLGQEGQLSGYQVPWQKTALDCVVPHLGRSMSMAPRLTAVLKNPRHPYRLARLPSSSSTPLPSPPTPHRNLRTTAATNMPSYIVSIVPVYILSGRACR